MSSTASRTIIIGDIHGCYDELTALLDLVQLEDSDSVIAVGDLIVKGKYSAAVLDRFIADARFSSVLGNHDLAVLKILRNNGKENIKAKKAHRACAEELSVDKKYQNCLASLPLYRELETHIIVHAGLRPQVELANQSTEDCTELRTLGDDRTSKEGTAWYQVYRHPQGKRIVFGHWAAEDIQRPQREPERALGIDTGCVYGNRLTAYVLESDELVSVPAQEIYEKMKK